MNGFWLVFYDGGGRLGEPGWHETQAAAEEEALAAFHDTEKIRAAVVWHRRDDAPAGGWRWRKVAELYPPSCETKGDDDEGNLRGHHRLRQLRCPLGDLGH